MSDDTTPTDAELLYGDPAAVTSGYRPYLSDALERYQDHTGIKDADCEALLTEASMGFNDAKIQSTAAQSLFSRMVHHSINPPDDATVSQWTAESRRVLRERFGEAEADKRIATSKAFIASRPTLAKLVGSMGSHPDVVMAITENAHRMRVKPLPQRKGK